MLYDVFISHASEDKEKFVRPLAEALRKHRVEVWYDEFSLKPGDSLRRSIDRGLTKSRYGVVVLSEHFFQKRWTEWELDGLVQRQLSSSHRLIIPIWHGVDRKTVADYSPPLADIIAVQSSAGLKNVVTALLRVLFPEGSTLLIARDSLIAKGFEPPVVTDDWWLDVVESSWHQWERRWHFPVWKMIPEDAHRGQLLAWHALQMSWQDEVEFRPITQITKPEIVLEFIQSQPGLEEVCARFPNYLLDYAPQLAIPGFGGKWEPIFDDMLARSVAESLARRQANSTFGSGLTTDAKTPACEDSLALRHPTFGNYDPESVACGFVQGNGAGVGPVVKAFDTFDYLMWLLSKQCKWLPDTHHSYLLLGMKEWAVWVGYGERPDNEAFKPNADTGKFSELIYKTMDAGGWKEFKMTTGALSDLRNRIDASRELLKLPESTDVLVQAFLQADCIKQWFNGPWQRRRRSQKATRKRKESVSK
jgi:hypothetical protein